MKIKFNDQWLEISSDTKLIDLLAINLHPEQSYAIAINYEFVPRRFYPEKKLRDNDIVDMIIPMQGG